MDKVEYIKELILHYPDLRDHDIKQLYAERIAKLPGILLTIDGLIKTARRELYDNNRTK